MRKEIFIFGFLFLLFAVFSLVSVPRLFSESETVLAKIGEMSITQRDLDELLNKYASLRQGKPFSAEEKKASLDNLVRGTLVSMEAERERLDERPEVKAKLRIARDDILIQEYLKVKIEPSITVTEKEIDEMMTANPNLIPKESITLKEILVKTEKEAKEVYEQLKKGGDFSRIAAEKSVAPSRVHGGLMRPVSRGQLPKPLEDVAYNLKKGELSQPIKTDQGYTILYLVDRKERSPEEIKKYEGIIREKVKQIEMSQKAQAALVKKGDELKQKTKVEVFYDRLQ